MRQEASREEKDKRNALDRARRARLRAQRVADGTYRAPALSTPEQDALAREAQEIRAGALDVPAHVLSSMDKRQLYLAYLEKGQRRSQAATSAGVKYSTVKYWRKTSDEFRTAEADVEETILDRVEDTLVRLALDGDLRAAEKVLAAKRAEVWAPKSRVEHAHQLHFAGSLEDRMSRIAELLEKVRPGELPPAVVDAEVVEDSGFTETSTE